MIKVSATKLRNNPFRTYPIQKLLFLNLLKVQAIVGYRTLIAFWLPRMTDFTSETD